MQIKIRDFKYCKLFKKVLFFYNKLRPLRIIPDKDTLNAQLYVKNH